jgi:hypothetical protein
VSFETIDDITLDDLLGLVDVAPEDKWREFKLLLPEKEPEANAEFVADATAFANAEGGYIFYGIAENPKTHLASAVLGIPTADVAKEQMRLENILRDHVRPRLPLSRMRPIDVGAGKSVLVLWLGRSHLAPHQNAYNWQVSIRNSAGKNAMEISELADMITRRESLPNRMRQYRQNRVNLIRSAPEDMPSPVTPEKKLVVHYIPEESFGLYDVVDVGQFNDPTFRGNTVLPLRNIAGFSNRANIDGYMYMNGTIQTEYGWYVQFFNDATVELVSGLSLAPSNDNTFHPYWIEVDLFHSFRFVREAYRKLKLAGRVSIMVSLLGMRDAEIYLGPGHIQKLMFTGHHSAIGRDPALFNEVTVPDMEENEERVMWPIIQQLWRACGYGNAASYNATGDFIGYPK